MRIKAKWVAALVYAAAVVLLSGIAFALIKETDYFWVTYGFTLAAASVLFGVIFYYLSDADRTFKQFPANAPYAYVAIQYLIAEVVLAAALWLICAATGLKLKYFISAELVLALVFGIRLVLAFGAKKYVVEGEAANEERYQTWRSLAGDIQALQRQAEALSTATQAALRRLYEAARYSDPIGRAETAALDTQIRDAISALRYELGQPDAAQPAAAERIAQIAARAERLIEERNDRLKTAK